MSCVRDNERYLAFPPAVSQAFLVHSGKVRHKIVGYEKATLENKKFNILVYLRGSSVYICSILSDILYLNIFSNI